MCAPRRGPPSGVSLWSDRRLQGDEFEGEDVGSGSSLAGQPLRERSVACGRQHWCRLHAMLWTRR
jgi:hypothetical protein